jgi:hypothetical protein
MLWLIWRSSAPLSQMEQRLFLTAAAEGIKMFKLPSSIWRFNRVHGSVYLLDTEE